MKKDDAQFKQATREAHDYSAAIQTAIETVSALHVKAGKPTQFMDPMSALLGVLGSFIAGVPAEVRPDVLTKCDQLLRIAVKQNLAESTGQFVKIVKKGKPQ